MPRRVLLVSGHASIQNVLTTVFVRAASEVAGLQIEVVTNGEEAYDSVRQSPLASWFIVCEWVLPILSVSRRRNGPELIRNLRADLPGSDIFFLLLGETIYPQRSEEIVVGILGAGGVDLRLDMPWRLEELENPFQRFLERTH